MGFDLAQTLGNVKGWTNYQLHQRMVQIALYGSIVFWILSSFHLIEEVNKLLTKFVGLKVGKEGTRVVHALIFGLFMYVGTQFILDPVFRRANLVEGADNGTVPDVPDVRDVVGADVVAGVVPDLGADVAGRVDVATHLVTDAVATVLDSTQALCWDGACPTFSAEDDFCGCWETIRFQECINDKDAEELSKVAKHNGCNNAAMKSLHDKN